MKKIKLILLCVSLSMVSAFGQTKATTDEGEKVILNEDGTWEYYKDTLTASSLDELSCEALCEKHVDNMTDRAFYSTKEALIISQDGETGITSHILKVLNSKQLSIIWNLRAIGSGCIDDNAKVIILFTDGSKIEFVANNDFNCEGDATVYFGGSFGKSKELNLLKTKKIDTIRVSARKGYVQESFDELQSESLRLAFECVSNYVD